MNFNQHDSFNQLVIQRALERIKHRLRERGIRYEDLARQLDVSLNTVKRILNHVDISMYRLMALAEICDLNINELLQDAKDNHAEHTYFTDRQDDLFANEPLIYDLFTALFYEELKPAAAAEQLKLEPPALYQALRKLENVGLLTLSTDNKVQFLVSPPLGFKPNSRVLRQQIGAYLDAAKESIETQNRGATHMLLIKPMRLPESTFEQLNLDLRRLVDKYAEASELMFRHRDDVPEYHITLVAGPAQRKL